MDIRKMLRYDIPRVKAIEEASFPKRSPSWKTDFPRCLKIKRYSCFVAEEYGEIHGYLICEEDKGTLYLTDVAVHPDKQRTGIGTAFFNFLKEKFVPKCKKTVLTVSERFLPTHLFLKSQGMKAVKVLRNYYSTGHDAYEFNYVQEKQTTVKERMKTSA